jgi:hypothetical protein
MIRNFRRLDGSSYTTLPDVFVYQKPWDDARRSLSLTEDGPPALIIEVLSEETYRIDLDLARGKGFGYGQAGVREYLTLDPNYSYVPDGGRGWRQADGVYRPWKRNATGRWASAVLHLAFGLEGARAAVYARDGHQLLREGEVERALRERDRRLQNEIQERQRAEVLAEQERREELARLEHAHAEELALLRRRLEELER